MSARLRALLGARDRRRPHRLGSSPAARRGASARRRGRQRQPSAALSGIEHRLPREHLQRPVRARRPIAALRRSAPADSPRACPRGRRAPDRRDRGGPRRDLLLHLVGPLGVPWWVPLICFGAMAVVIGGMQRVARNRREGFWNGLAVPPRPAGAQPNHRPGDRRGRDPDRPQLAAAQLDRRRRLGVRFGLPS